MSQLAKSEEKATEKQKENFGVALDYEVRAPKTSWDYSRQEAENQIKTPKNLYEERRVGQVEIDKVYSILKTEKEGEYFVASEGSNYLIKPKKRQCECKGFLYEKHCKHLDHASFVDLWKKLGEYVTAPVSVQPPSIEKLTEAKLAEEVKFILGDDIEKKVVIHQFQVKGEMIEMLSAETIIALGNYLGVESDTNSEIKSIENTDGNLLIIETKGTAKFLHPRGHFLSGTSTVMQTLNIEDLRRRGTDLVQRSVESKAKRKAILRVLPVTEKGMMSKIKKIYGWK